VVPTLYHMTYSTNLPPLAGLTIPLTLLPPLSVRMDNRLTFLPVRVPAILPHPNDLLITLAKDEFSSSFHITTPLTLETIPDNNEARATLHTINHLCQAFTSPHNTSDTILNRPTWLCMIMETIAGIHEGFHNMQLATPDKDLPDAFHHLSTNKLNMVARFMKSQDSSVTFVKPQTMNTKTMPFVHYAYAVSNPSTFPLPLQMSCL
jgi:hypothetical protein